MRGISSMFGSKRSEKSTPPSAASTSHPIHSLLESKKPSRIFGTVSRRPALSNVHTKSDDITALDNAPATSSSSASSSGSNSLRTPRDDEGLRRSSSKASWMSWLGSKKPALVTKPAIRGEEWDIPRQEWRSRPPPVLLPPPSRSEPIIETEDESCSESEDDSDAASISVPFTTPSITPSTLAKSRANLRAMLESSLQPPFSPPPLLLVPEQPMFPRSCNKRRSLYTHETMQSRMHKSRLLKGLDSRQTTRADELTVVSFCTRTPTFKRPSLQLDDEALPLAAHVRTYSQGLQKWALRPCFEDRVMIWASAEGTGTILSTRVAGTNFGVAALEISEALDALAGANVDESEIELPASSSTNSLLLPPASHSIRNSPTLPSPLRMEHNQPQLPSAIRLATPPERTMPSVPTVKRGVRFAEDDKDDQIPLGYIVRIKKRREEKIKLLQEEKERRAFEEERAKQDQERMRRDAERVKWEKEKKAWELEKREMEEEKRKQQYAEEVAAARQRREAARSGFYVPTPSQEKARPQFRESRSSTSDRNSAHLHPWRQASEVGLGSGTPYTASPASSNPPSLNGGSPNASSFFSRPESIGSANTTLSSTEDIRQKKNVSKRASLGADHLQHQMVAMPYYPVWGNPYAVPMVPAVPFYHNLDMPLLPPTPPFMLQQSRRSQSPNSRSNNSRSSSPRPHSSSSQQNGGSTDRLSISQHSSSSALPIHESHRRQSSDDAIKAIHRPAAPERRSGSAVDVRGRQSAQYANTAHTQRSAPQIAPPPPSRSQGQWATNTFPRDSRGRPSASQR